MANKAQLENELRNEILETIRQALSEHFDADVLDVSASEITLPLVDAEQNEKFGLIKVSIPRGTRNGSGYDPYDGYAAAEEWAHELEERATKKAKAEENKKKTKKTKEQKQVAKAIENLENAGLG